MRFLGNLAYFDLELGVFSEENIGVYDLQENNIFLKIIFIAVSVFGGYKDMKQAQAWPKFENMIEAEFVSYLLLLVRHL